MKTNMTERDKKLLVGMFIGVIIVAIGYWGILPQIKQYKALEAKIQREEAIQKINKIKILNAGTLEVQADDYESRIAERKDEFYPVMNSSQVDKIMTELAVGNNLNVYDLSFNMPSSPTSRVAYKNSSLYTRQQQMMAEYTPSETTDTSSSDDLLVETTEATDSKSKKSDNEKVKMPTETEEDIMAAVMGGIEGGYQPNTDIYAVPITITVGGEIRDLENFIEQLNNLDKRALVIGYSWGEFRDVIKRDADGNIISTTAGLTGATSSVAEDGSSVEVITRKSLTVRLEIYMCDTSDVATTTDAESE